MSTRAGLVARVRALVRRRAADAELDDEIRFHLDMETEKNRRAGMAPDEARRIAVAHFGGVQRVREEHRDVRRLAWLEDLFGDARFATRSMRRTPGLALTIVLTLSLCIGATSAVYGVIYHLLLAPLPYPDGNGIVSLETRSEADRDVHWAVGSELMRLWEARARTLADFSVYTETRGVLGPRVAQSGPPDSVPIAYVSPSFLPMLRVRPLLGRTFAPGDYRSHVPVAMLDEGAWRSRFGGDPALVGRRVDVDGVRRTVIGIVPGVARRPMDNEDAPPAIWLPLPSDSATAGYAFARLRPGVTSAVASRELEAIMRTLPDTGWLHGRRAVALTARDRVDPERRDALELLFLAACALLLIASADIAGLLLMRGWARRREFAIRRAMGASRSRVLRQQLTEAVLLVVPGGALGALVAWLALKAAVAIGPGDISADLAKARVDTPMLLWTLGVSVAIALFAGVGPALLAGRRASEEVLRADDARTGRSHRSSRAHQGLVVAQIALCFVFLAAASVLGRSFVALVRTPVGYDPAGLFAVHVRLSRAQPRTEATDGFTLARVVRNALAATPGVRDVAIGPQPMNSMTMGPTAVEGRNGVRPSGVPITGGARVGPRYFQLVGIRLMRGRDFDAAPGPGDEEVILNDALARRLWPDRDALGARLREGDGSDAKWLTVVGIAGDVRMPGPAPLFFDLQMYRPASVARQFDGAFVLRADGDVASLRPLLARAVERAAIGATLDDVVPAGRTLEYAFRAPRFALALFGAFALLAVVLAAAGLFGIVSYAVARRTRELGVRVALGAAPATLAHLVLGQSARIVALGCGIGLLGAFGVSRGLRALVYHVSPTDPAAISGAAAFLTVVTLTASLLPVRRALRIDPIDVLRAE